MIRRLICRIRGHRWHWHSFTQTDHCGICDLRICEQPATEGDSNG